MFIYIPGRSSFNLICVNPTIQQKLRDYVLASPDVNGILHGGSQPVNTVATGPWPTVDGIHNIGGQVVGREAAVNPFVAIMYPTQFNGVEGRATFGKLEITVQAGDSIRGELRMMNLSARDLDASFADMVTMMSLASGDPTAVKSYPLRKGMHSYKFACKLEDEGLIGDFRDITYQRLPCADFEALSPILVYFHNVRYSTDHDTPPTVKVVGRTTMQTKTDILQHNLATKHTELETLEHIKALRAELDSMK